jgi:hypothetical protein
MKPNLTQFYTSIGGKPGFDQTVEVVVNQTLKVESREAADKLLAEYPTAAEWADDGEPTTSGKAR